MLTSGQDRAAVWEERMRRYERSEGTVAEFCERERVSVPSFYHWRKRLIEPSNDQRPKRLTGKPAPRAARGFQQVLLSDGGVVAVVLPSGVRMELPAHQMQLVRVVVADLLQAEAGRLVGDA